MSILSRKRDGNLSEETDELISSLEQKLISANEYSLGDSTLSPGFYIPRMILDQFEAGCRSNKMSPRTIYREFIRSMKKINLPEDYASFKKEIQTREVDCYTHLATIILEKENPCSGDISLLNQYIEEAEKRAGLYNIDISGKIADIKKKLIISKHL